MLESEASGVLDAAAFGPDTVIDGAKTVTARYTVSLGAETVEGEATLVAVGGRVRHVYFVHSSGKSLPIESCGTAAWRKAPPGNPGNVTECRVVQPTLELLSNKSGPVWWFGLLDTNYATRAVSASRSQRVPRKACAGTAG